MMKRLLAMATMTMLMCPAWGLDALSPNSRLGPTYPIQERDMIEEIQAKLKGMEKSGRLSELQREAVARSRRSVEAPAPVASVRKTTMPRTFYFDPSMRVPRDIVTPDGAVIARAGERINPLDHISLSQHLVFFDQRDAAQVKQALALIDRYQGAVKPILVGGEPLRLMRQWKKQVYFDQGGRLVARFGIRQVPALVTQDTMSKRLRIDELKSD